MDTRPRLRVGIKPRVMIRVEVERKVGSGVEAMNITARVVVAAVAAVVVVRWLVAIAVIAVGLQVAGR